MITVSLDYKGVKEQLKLLALPPKKRQRLVWRAAESLKKLAARNVRQQKSPDGTSWAPRKRGKRKLLQGLPKSLVIHEPSAVWPELFIRFGKGNYKTTGGKAIHAGVVAASHQHGFSQTVSAESRKKIAPNEASRGKPATKAQARKLRELGFKRPGKRKGKYRSASIGWITENINYPQAGLLIKKLKGDPRKQSWNITVPARPFLGANTKQREQAFARALQSINYGWDVNKQEMKRK